MNEASRFMAEVRRRVATIEGQLKGIERLFQKEDVPQALTQLAAVRNALESVVRVLLQVSITRRFAMKSISERPEDVFEHALERAMTHWFSANVLDTGAAAPPADEAEFSAAVRRCSRSIEDRLRDIGAVLEGHNYLEALRELGAMRWEVDELVKLALCRLIRDRMAEKRGPRKVKDVFERAVGDALKYWHLPDPRGAAPTPHKSGGKVLVVDDDPDVVDYVRYILEKRAFEVISAPNAEEAMTKVEAEKPDLIILDIMMPKGTEGFHFAWRLRARSEPEYRNTPIIVLTAIHDTTSLRFYPDQSDGFYGPGEYLPVEGFIDKPVKEDDLLKQVERVLGPARRDTDQGRQTV